MPLDATAFGLRQDHVLVEIIAAWDDTGNLAVERDHRDWARATLQALASQSLPGGYPNLLSANDSERVASAYGSNLHRLKNIKHKYDPENMFRSAIPLVAERTQDAPATQSTAARPVKRESQMT